MRIESSVQRSDSVDSSCNLGNESFQRQGRKRSPGTYQLHLKISPKIGKAFARESKQLGISQGQMIEQIWSKCIPMNTQNFDSELQKVSGSKEHKQKLRSGNFQIRPRITKKTGLAITKLSKRLRITQSRLIEHIWTIYASSNQKFENLEPKISNPKRDSGKQKVGNVVKGKDFRFYCSSSLTMSECSNESIALTVTSPPYWNAIDYDIHANQGQNAWHRERDYQSFGETFEDYLNNISDVFNETLRITVDGGFCAIVVGTILYKRKHYPTPMLITQRMLTLGWEFHQDIIWNKVTGGVKRAGSFIQHKAMGYYYPNIMTEYILVFRKPGEIRRGNEPALDIDTLFTRDIANNVWHIAPIPPGQIDHPCPYPQELVRRLIVLYSKRGEEILDPFLGSGQTAIVALQEGRKCVGYDIERSYLELSVNRIKNPPAPRANNLLPKFEKVAIS